MVKLKLKLILGPPHFLCLLERVCLKLQKTLNPEKWQYFKIKYFSFLVSNFMISHLNQYIIDALAHWLYFYTCIYKYRKNDKQTTNL